MIRGTTPTITLKAKFDLRGWNVYTTIKNGLTEITFEGTQVSVRYENGYSFVCWIDSNPSGWIASTYMENPTRQTTNVWVATNQTTTSGTGTVLCFSLYVKNL